MKIIGLGHYSRTGKDTVANRIVEVCESCTSRIKARKVSLAWKLKQIAHELYEWAGIREPEFYETKEGASFRSVPLPALGGKTVVDIWVDLGTPAIRDQVYDRTWIDYVLKSDFGDIDLLIVPDVRFPNEFNAFQEEGAKLIKVIREGYGPLDTVSDKALVGQEDWDYFAGPTMEDLNNIAVLCYNWAAFGAKFPEQTYQERKRILGLEKT